MKKRILFFVFSLIMLHCYGQDSIRFTNSKLIPVKILSYEGNFISYIPLTNNEEPIAKENKKNIQYIRYSTGDIEFYEEQENFGSVNAAEKGEKATIILKSFKEIPCELMDITNEFIVYREYTEETKTKVMFKSDVSKIWKSDSTFSTFSETGKEEKHEKPKPEPPKPVPVVVKPEPEPVEPETKVKTKEENYKIPSCGIMDNNANRYQVTNAEVNFTNKTITYTDQYKQLVIKGFQDLVAIYFTREGSSKERKVYFNDKTNRETFTGN